MSRKLPTPKPGLLDALLCAKLCSLDALYLRREITLKGYKHAVESAYQHAIHQLEKS